MSSTVKLLQLCSQALPVGAYAYSTGLESAIDNRLVFDQPSTAAWLGDMLKYSLGELDLPALIIAFEAWTAADHTTIEALDEYLQASRETDELLLEDVQMGRALRKLLKANGIETGTSATPSYVTQFACAGTNWHIPLDDLMTGYCFSWLENQVGVATKTIPLGQTESQILLGQLAAMTEGIVIAATEVRRQAGTPWNFGISLNALAILSSQHETLASRLYRS